jgi:quinol monooxygenase YgiN
MITLIAHIRVKRENAPQFEALMTEVCDQVRRHESGVPYYGFGRSVDDDETFVVVEVYRDVVAHSAHMSMPWVRESLPKAASLMEGRPAVVQYVTAGSAPVQLAHFARPKPV